MIERRHRQRNLFEAVLGSVEELVEGLIEPPLRRLDEVLADEALLEESLRTGDVFVRLYRWSEATVSLGYFQKATDCDTNERLATLPVVRRLSGGGAILHHHEQTYSCCLPPKHPIASQPLKLYDLIHSVFIEFPLVLYLRW